MRLFLNIDIGGNRFGAFRVDAEEVTFERGLERSSAMSKREVNDFSVDESVDGFSLFLSATSLIEGDGKRIYSVLHTFAQYSDVCKSSRDDEDDKHIRNFFSIDESNAKTFFFSPLLVCGKAKQAKWNSKKKKKIVEINDSRMEKSQDCSFHRLV